MTLHIELGNIIRKKYIEAQKNTKEYANFSNVENMQNHVKIYSSKFICTKFIFKKKKYI
jgi:hypothetical protein